MIEQLFKTRKRLLEEISGLSYKEFNRTPHPDKWSIGQVAHHLVLSEQSFSRAIAYGLSKDDSCKTNPKKTHFILDRSQRVDAPKFVMPEAGPFEIKSIIDMLGESRKILLKILDEIENPEILTLKSAKHPVFGELPLYQWVELLYMHEQRHIEQIREIKVI